MSRRSEGRRERSAFIAGALVLAREKLERGELHPGFVEETREFVAYVREQVKRNDAMLERAKGLVETMERDVLSVQADALLEDALDPTAGHMAAATKCIRGVRGSQADLLAAETDVEVVREALAALEAALARGAG